MHKKTRSNPAVAGVTAVAALTVLSWLWLARERRPRERCELSLPDGGRIVLARFGDADDEFATERPLLLGRSHPHGETNVFVLAWSDYRGLGLPLSLSLKGGRVQIRNGLLGRGNHDLVSRHVRYDGKMIIQSGPLARSEHQRLFPDPP